MIKLIVSDFDGTLMPYGRACVPESVKKRLENALDKGIAVAVSSGRTYGELASLLPEFEDRLWFICCDGAYYVQSGRVFYERKIESADLSHFFATVGNGASAVLHGAKKNYSAGSLPSVAEKFCAVPVSRVTDIKEKIFKVTAYGADTMLWNGSGLRMHWDGGEQRMAQYVNRFANKGVALSDLQMRLMLTKFETACIGDSGNDIAMMHNAKYSFAVGNRSDELKAAVKESVDSVENALDALLDI